MALTVTASASGAGSSNGIMLAPLVYTGASLTQTGATSQSATITAPEQAITPGHAGSVVVGAVGTGASGTAFSSPAGPITQVANASVVVGSRWGIYRSGPTTTSSTTYGWAAPTEASGNIYLAQAEIRAATALGLDLSTPAVASAAGAKTVTSDSFAPPAGAVIIAAVIASWAGSGAVSTTVSDSSGAYTWTKLAGTGTVGLCSIWAGIPASATGTGSASLGSMRATGTLLVRNPVSGTAVASLRSLRATGLMTVGLPAPGGYPDADLGEQLEFNLGGWTDVTDQTDKSGQQAASIKNGQAAGAPQPQPAALNLVMDNGAPGMEGAFSPRNVSGPWYGQLRQNTAARMSVSSPYGNYLRLEAGSSDRAYVNDTSALHVTGSIEARIEMRLSDWRGCVLAARYDNTTPSWYLIVNADGTLTWSWFDSGGTQHTVTSTVPLPYAGGFFAVAARLDASAGTLGFYTSDGIDGTFALLGDQFTVAAGARSVRAGNAPLVVGWSANAIGGQLLGQVRDFRLYNGASVAAEAEFSGQPGGVTAWHDSAGSLWQLAGGAELSGRDFRMHGELSVITPSADTSGSLARVAMTVSGRSRRLQQGAAPAAFSPLKRAILSQAGDLAPVAYWTMEDGTSSTQFGPSAGSQLMTVPVTGSLRAAADSSFEASAPLPTLDGASLYGPVDPYTGATAWVFRFLCKVGSLPASGQYSGLARVLVSGGTITQVDLNVDSSGNLQLTGRDVSTAVVFDTGFTAFGVGGKALWYSIEAVPAGSGQWQYSVVTLAPGATSGASYSAPAVTGSLGTVSAVEFNTIAPTLTDTVVGHPQVQKAWTSMFSLYEPLNAWRGELAGDRFTRICAEEGIASRMLGAPGITPAMGPQPAGTVWGILKDCAWADQGLLFEPADSLSIGFRTRYSMSAQAPAVTLDFAAANLPGNLAPADDDLDLVNDITASMPDGTQVRAVLDDGSPYSVSAPPAGMGRYMASPPAPFNVQTAAQLQVLADWYLAARTTNAARYRQLGADFGIPGAPAADLALLRAGDLVKITSVPALFQSTDIEQLVTGALELLGPGRKVTWNCVPAAPYASYADWNAGAPTSGGGGGGSGGTGGGGTTYTQSLIDAFSGSSLDSSIWRVPVGGDGVSVSGGKLIIDAISGDEQVVACRVAGHDLSTGIFALQLSQSGTTASGTMFFLGFNDDPELLANYYEFQTYPLRPGWYSWADGSGATTSGDTGSQNILSTSVWSNGDWLAIGNYNLNGSGDVHVYKSPDAVTWTEIASFEVTGPVNESDVFWYFGTNYDPGTGSSNYVATIDNASFFTRHTTSGGTGGGTGGGSGSGTFSPATTPILGMYETAGAFPTPGPTAWASGAKTNLSATYLAFPDADWATYAAPFVARCNANGLVPFVELEPWHFNQSAIPFSDITGGTYDSQLTAIGSAIAAAGIDVILTWAHEFNVSGQYPWAQNFVASTGKTASGPGGADVTPAEWVTCWQYVVNKIRSTAGGHALFMWACSAWTGGTTINPAPYWPGASYVDMVGIDGYPNTQYGASLGTFAGQIQPTVGVIRSLGWSSPIYISETNLAQMVASGGQSITGFVAAMAAAGVSGVLEFEDAAWGLSPMSSAQWTEYNAAVAAYYGG